MIEITTKEQLSDFLDRYTFALKEQQDTILRFASKIRALRDRFRRDDRGGVGKTLYYSRRQDCVY